MKFCCVFLKKSMAGFCKKTATSLKLLFVVFFLGVTLFSCLGKFSKKPPIHLNLNMDNQPKKGSQSLSLSLPFGVFSYGRSTNPRDRRRMGFLKKSNRPYVFPFADVAFYYGLSVKDEDRFEITDEIVAGLKKSLMDTANPSNKKIVGEIDFVSRIPLRVDRSLITRGLQKFMVYCSICHGLRGVGDGLVIERRAGMPPPPDLSSVSSRALSDGKIFNLITYGRSGSGMPAYAAQLSEGDRWAIVSYIRTLQRARNGTFEEYKEAKRKEKQGKKK